MTRGEIWWVDFAFCSSSIYGFSLIEQNAKIPCGIL